MSFAEILLQIAVADQLGRISISTFDGVMSRTKLNLARSSSVEIDNVEGHPSAPSRYGP